MDLSIKKLQGKGGSSGRPSLPDLFVTCSFEATELGWEKQEGGVVQDEEILVDYKTENNSSLLSRRIIHPHPCHVFLVDRGTCPAF